MTRFQPAQIVLDRYEITYLIAAGGYGEVYRAVQLSTGQSVAIKTLHQSRIDEDADNAITRFNREMQVIAALNHPNIVDLKDSGEFEGDLLMVLEFVEGEDLADRLERGALSPALARRISVQTLEALQFAHRQGVVHRDLKPANIMLTGSADRPVAKVLDFGIAAIAGGQGQRDALGGEWQQLTEPDVILGTAAYMAPEQLRRGRVNPQCDIYAMGLILLEMITGRRAIVGDTSIDIAMKQLNEPTPIPDGVDATAVGQIILRACQKDPDRRYQTVDEMLAELEALTHEDLSDPRVTTASLSAGDMRTGGGPASRGRPVVTTSKGMPWLAIGVVAMLLAGVLAAVLVLTLGKSGPASEAPDDDPETQAQGEGAGKALASALTAAVAQKPTSAFHGALSRLGSIYSTMAELQVTGQEMLTLFCNCYTPVAFGGDRAACESSYDLVAELECGQSVYPTYQTAAIGHMECLRLSMQRFSGCIASCPDLNGPDGNACLEQTTNDAAECRRQAPLGMLEALDACTGP